MNPTNRKYLIKVCLFHLLAALALTVVVGLFPTLVKVGAIGIVALSFSFAWFILNS